MEFVQLDKKFFKEEYRRDADLDYDSEAEQLINLLNDLFNWVSAPNVSSEVTDAFLDTSIVWLVSYGGSYADYAQSIFLNALDKGNYRIHSVKDKNLLEETKKKISDGMYNKGFPSDLQDLYSSLNRVVTYLTTHDNLLASATGLAILTPDKEVNKGLVPFAKLIWVSEITNEIAFISIASKSKDKKTAFSKLDAVLGDLINQPCVSKGSLYDKSDDTLKYLKENLEGFEFDEGIQNIVKHVRSLVKVIRESKDGTFKVKITNRTSIPTFVGLPEDGVVYFDAVTSTVSFTPDLTAAQRVDVLELLLQCQFIAIQDLPVEMQVDYLLRDVETAKKVMSLSSDEDLEAWLKSKMYVF
jgi:hypothetical protein